uniref:Uncharacterized protein n=1 Tax=Anguilla anguilla TaxID=7936 RepID=A0A0E9VLF3_ANGAN
MQHITGTKFYTDLFYILLLCGPTAKCSVLFQLQQSRLATHESNWDHI